MNDDRKKATENETDKIGVSCYLTSKTLEKIDDFSFYAKKRLPLEKRRKLKKSVFYEIGLRTVIEDYNMKGEKSELWKAICDFVND